MKNVAIVSLIVLIGFALRSALLSNNTDETTEEETQYLFPTPIPTITQAMPNTRIQFTDETHYYAIEGTTFKELRQQITEEKGNLIDGVRYGAQTEWYTTWRYPWKVTSAGCDTGPVTLKLDLDVTYPEWSNKDQGDTEAQQQWEHYMIYLYNHETHHKNLIIQESNTLLNMIESVPPQKTCNHLDAMVNSVAEPQLDFIEEINNQYDEITDHGRNE